MIPGIIPGRGARVQTAVRGSGGEWPHRGVAMLFRQGSTIPLVPNGTGYRGGNHVTIDRRALAGVLAALLLVAACGGSASQAPTAAPGATGTPAAEATPGEGSQEPTDTAEPTEGPDASFVTGAAGDLEAKLPDEVNGVKFAKTSFDGNSFPVGVPIGDTEMEQLLKDSGKSLKDVRVALATPADTSAATAGNMVMALQIQGADSGKLEEWATGQLGDSSATKSTVGGKEVYGSSAPGVGGAYFYVKDDVIYYVIAFGADNLAEGILQQLP